MPPETAPATAPETGLALTRRARRINRELAELYPDAHCELDFTNALELSVATILSVIIPGLGQLYNRDTKKGLIMFAAAVVGIVAATGITNASQVSASGAHTATRRLADRR